MTLSNPEPVLCPPADPDALTGEGGAVGSLGGLRREHGARGRPVK